jgi:hypothetical protein
VSGWLVVPSCWHSDDCTVIPLSCVVRRAANSLRTTLPSVVDGRVRPFRWLVAWVPMDGCCA